MYGIVATIPVVGIPAIDVDGNVCELFMIQV